MSNKSRKVSCSSLTTLSKVDVQEHIKLMLDMTNPQSKTLLEAIISAMSACMISKKSLLLTGVGTLAVAHKNSRPGRNPKTNESFEIKECYSITLRKGVTDTERLNKPQIIEEISKLVPNLPFYKVKKAFELFVNLIKTVKTGGIRIEIKGFGVFYPSYYPERKARNPKTGENVTAPEKTLIKYLAAKKIKTELNLQ